MDFIDLSARKLCSSQTVAQARLEALAAVELAARLREREPEIQRQVDEQMSRPKQKFAVTSRFDEEGRFTGYTFTGSLDGVISERADKLITELDRRTLSPAHSHPEPKTYQDLAKEFPDLLDYRTEYHPKDKAPAI